jgi:hypothetical protein
MWIIFYQLVSIALFVCITCEKVARHCPHSSRLRLGNSEVTAFNADISSVSLKPFCQPIFPHLCLDTNKTVDQLLCFFCFPVVFQREPESMALFPLDIHSLKARMIE